MKQTAKDTSTPEVELPPISEFVTLAIAAGARFGACINAPAGATALDPLIGAVPKFAEETLATYECIAEAESCAELIFRCFNSDVTRTCSSSSKPRCDGSVKVNCLEFGTFGSYEAAVDCETNPDMPFCIVGEDSAQCSARQEPCGASWCDGHQLQWCASKSVLPVDCGETGHICSERSGDAQDHACHLDGGCVRQCVGDMLTHCTDAGPYVGGNFDCGSLGSDFRCDSGPNGSSGCDARFGQCTHGDTKCFETTLSTCVFGRWVRVDCADFADGTCVSKSGASRCEESAASNAIEWCKDECTSAGWSCSGEASRVRCVEKDGCLRREQESCGDQRCYEGYCVPKCSNECTSSGDTVCNGAEVVTCILDDKGCLAWGPSESCGGAKSCLKGQCVTCADECETLGTRYCSGNTVLECTNLDVDPCPEERSLETCGAGKKCSAGKCVDDCIDECDDAGDTQCSAGLVSTCGQHDGDSCLEWGKFTSCGAGKLCVGDACSCVNPCPSTTQNGCEGDKVATCGTGTGACLVVKSTTTCADGDACVLGVCSDPPLVVISELARLNLESTIELRGPAGLNLHGWSLTFLDEQGEKVGAALPLLGSLDSKGFWVVSSAPAPKDYADLAGQPFGLQSTQSVVLRQGLRVVDAVAFGNFTSVEDAFGEGATAPVLPAGKVLARNADGRDTDDNFRDFRIQDATSFGVANSGPNTPPVPVWECPTVGAAGQLLLFDASASYDFEGEVVWWDFSWGTGGGVSGPIHDTWYAKPGTYQVTLVIKDSQGFQTTDTCTVTIVESTPPTINWIAPLMDVTIGPGAAVTLTVDAVAAPGRAIVGVTFLVDGVPFGAMDTVPPYKTTFTVPSTAPEIPIAIVARALDDLGEEGMSSPRTLLVVDAQPIAKLTATPIGVATARFDPTGSTDAEGPLTARWDFGSDGTFETTWGPLEPINWTFDGDGTHTATLEVRDSTGKTAQATASVVIESDRTVTGVTSDETWYGTIRVQGDVVIPAGVTVTLLPNVELNGDDVSGGSLTVRGVVIGPGGSAIGASSGTPAMGLRVDGAGRLELATATLRGTGIEVESGELHLSDSTVEGGPGISLRGGATAITGVTMTGVAVELESEAVLKMTTSTIMGSPRAGLRVRAGHVEVHGSSFQQNDDVGIWLSGAATGSIERSVITANDLEGLRITSDGHSFPDVVIEFNDIYGNCQEGYTGEVYGGVKSVTSSGTSLATLAVTPTTPIITASFSYDEGSNAEATVKGIVRGSDGEALGVFDSDTVVGTSPTDYTMNFEPPESSLTLEVDDQNPTSDAKLTIKYFGLRIKPLPGGLPYYKEVFSRRHDRQPLRLRKNWWGTNTKINLGVNHNSYYLDQSGFALGPLNDGPIPKDTGTVPTQVITTDTVWSGPRVIAGTVSVTSGATLTIAAGSVLEFARLYGFGVKEDGTKLVVQQGGSIQMQGTAAAPILAQPAPFGDESTPGYTLVAMTEDGELVAEHVECDDAESAFLFHAGDATLSNVIVRDAANAITVSNVDALTVSKSLITGTTGAGVVVSGTPKEMDLIDTTIADGLDWGLVVTAAKNESFDVLQSSISANALGGILVESGGVTLTSSDVKYNGYGIVISRAGTATLSSSNILFNDLEGIAVLSREPASTIHINGNNIYANGTVGGTDVTEVGFAGSSTTSGLEQVMTTFVAPEGDVVVGAMLTYTSTAQVSGNSIRVTPIAASSAVFLTTAPFDDWFVLRGLNVNGIQFLAEDPWTNAALAFSVSHAAHLQRSSPSERELVLLAPPGTTLNATGNYWGDIVPAVDSLLGGTIDTSGALAGPVTPAGPPP
ncbi:MAG: right-handed parallel beta-helix repeat-containing protein [Myxococcales bacterium]|nr:right-handed parallel beta-helix repeat-containing protein [Myxococcales bacterium]